MSQFDLDWGNIKEPNQGGNIDFYKLQPGENKMRIVSKPSLVEIHWEKDLQGQSKKVVCPGAGCPICKAGHAPMSRYQIKVIDKGANVYDAKNKEYRDGVKVKVLEGGSTIFNAIKALAHEEDFGDPTKYDIKIKKEGQGRETKYTVLPNPNKFDLTKEELTAVESSKSLAEINKAKTIEEIMGLGLECLAGSMADLDVDDFNSSSNNSEDDDWEDL